MAGPPTTSPPRRAGTALLAIVAAVAVLPGCGEPSDSGDAAPASLAPGDAPAYAEVQLDPTGDQEAAVASIAERFGAGADPAYEGVDYRVGTTNQIAAGIVEGFLVVGSDGGLRAAVDAASGESLLDSDRYEAAVDGLPSERLAALYADTARIGELVAETEELSGPESQLLER